MTNEGSWLNDIQSFPQIADGMCRPNVVSRMCSTSSKRNNVVEVSTALSDRSKTQVTNAMVSLVHVIIGYAFCFGGKPSLSLLSPAQLFRTLWVPLAISSPWLYRSISAKTILTETINVFSVVFHRILTSLLNVLLVSLNSFLPNLIRMRSTIQRCLHVLSFLVGEMPRALIAATTRLTPRLKPINTSCLLIKVCKRQGVCAIAALFRCLLGSRLNQNGSCNEGRLLLAVSVAQYGRMNLFGESLIPYCVNSRHQVIVLESAKFFASRVAARLQL